jgi:hypothetical protein
MTTIAVVQSKSRNARHAGSEACAAALQQLGGKSPDVVLVFANPGYDQQALITAIRDTAGPRPLISGCSSEGVIFRGGCDENPCVVNLMAIASDRIKFDAFNVGGFSKDPVRCGKAIADRIRELGPERAKAAFVFPDGVLGDCTAMLRALHEALPFPIPIAGGAAGDLMNAEASYELKTYQYLGEQVNRDSVSALFLGGDVELDIEVSHGCTALGLPRAVTRSDGGWVHEVDGRPAVEVFREYLDDTPDNLLATDLLNLTIGEPLAEHLRKDYNADHLIRTPIGQDGNALFFPGGLQLGDQVQFMRREPDRVGTSAKQSAARLAGRRLGQRPVAVFQFDCAGRGYLLFGDQTAGAAIRPLQDEIREVPWFGFHTYGEIAPIDNEAFYHNSTVVLCALYETAIER